MLVATIISNMTAERDRKYKLEIQQMMFVSGEVSEPLSETTGLVEDIVRAQVVEMIVQATAQAARRSSKSISVDDLIFLIRHDRAKVNRLRTYLSWKDVRKKAREDGKDDGQDVEVEDLAAGPDAMKARKKARVRLPWDVSNMFPEPVPEGDSDEDEEAVEANAADLQRLKNEDERTRAMTKDEYVHYSECRQSSFTYRKSKRFRDWIGMSSLIDSKPIPDIIDVLGFLTFDIVATLTEEALKVKADQEKGGEETGSPTRKRRRIDGEGERYLFDGPSEEKSPLRAKHVMEAFRRLQAQQVRNSRGHVLRNFGGGLVKTKVGLI